MKINDENAPREAIGIAGGKVILLGEHAVVHGTAALAIGLPNKVKVTAKPKIGSTELVVRAWDFSSIVNGDRPEDKALLSLCETLGVKTEGVALVGETKLPARAGMGASAAIAAATSRALVAYFQMEKGLGDIFEAVQASEKIFHGNPSGLDAATVLVNGIVRYTQETGPGEIKCAQPNLVIVHSGEAGNTKETVALFAKRLKDYPDEGRRRLDRIGKLVAEGENCLFAGDMKGLGKLMTENHFHLEWFGVSTDALNHICKAAISGGALGAKLTGGGGGGCAAVLVTQSSRPNVIKKIREAGFRVVLQ